MSSIRPHMRRPRLFAVAIATGVIMTDLFIGVAVRTTLPVSNRAAGWLLRPVLLDGHTEHTGDRVSFGTAIAVIGMAFVVWTAPRICSIRFFAPCLAVGIGAGLANKIEVALRGSASDYLAFRHLPFIDSGVYNAADVEMIVAGVGAICALGWAWVKSHHRQFIAA